MGLLAAAVFALSASGDTLWAKYHHGMVSPTRPHTIDMVRDFIAVGDGSTLNTAVFNKAIDAAAAWNSDNNNAGVEIVFPNQGGAVFLTAPVNLTSFLTLTIQGGATLLASDDASLWPIVDPLPSYGRGRDHNGPRYAPFIGGSKLSDIVLHGPGTIDGAGAKWWALHKSGKEKYTRGRLVEFLWSDGILFEDIKLTNSPFWTVHPTYSSNVIARRLTIDNPNDAPNTDGFDPDSTVNVSLTDSYFSVGDDGVAIKSGWDCFGLEVNMPSANIYINNLTVKSPCCAGICIGSEMSGGVKNVLVENSLLITPGQGLRIKSGLGRGAYVENITYRNIEIQDAVKWVIQVNDYYGSKNSECGLKNATALPVVQGIVFDNITATGGAGAKGADFEGLPLMPIRTIALRNVRMNMPSGTNYSCSLVSGTYDNGCVPTPCGDFDPAY
eukprot:Hpha_TRINITY_DN16496_c0_g9::TRINITY_DN16496_c0_g9_i1::g.162774::m.162774